MSGNESDLIVDVDGTVRDFHSIGSCCSGNGTPNGCSVCRRVSVLEYKEIEGVKYRHVATARKYSYPHRSFLELQHTKKARILIEDALDEYGHQKLDYVTIYLVEADRAAVKEMGLCTHF